jgi:hypothetical protein
MKLRKYNGKLKKRQDLEMILQEMLPKKANVMFATLIKRPIIAEYGGPSGQKEDCLAFWEIGHLFICVHAVRTMLPHEITGRVQVSPWRIAAEGRVDAKQELARCSDPNIHWPPVFNELKDALRELYAKMVEMEAEWGITPEEAETVLASERFSPRRN